MGNRRSSFFEQKQDDLDVWWLNSTTNEIEVVDPVVVNDTKNLSKESDRKLDEFKLELVRKREKRKEIINWKKKEMEELREEIRRLKQENNALRSIQTVTEENEALQTTPAVFGKDDSLAVKKSRGENEALGRKLVVPEKDETEEIQRLRKENEELRSVQAISGKDDCDTLHNLSRLEQENETLKMIVKEKDFLLVESEKIIEKNRDLRIETVKMQQELQRLNNEMLSFERERTDYKAHVVALKDVIAVSKNMLQIRELELIELKAKIEEIEKSLAEKEIQLLSKNLRSEYERQMANIRDLRALYEERQRAAHREKDELVSQLDDAKKELEEEQNKNKELEDRLAHLEEDKSKKYDEIKQLESNVGLIKAESRQYQAELTVINQLFSEILLGFNTTQEIDLDKLQKHLEQHHGLLQDIVVNEVASVSYALPKVLLDLVNQIEAKKNNEETEIKFQRENLATEEEAESIGSTFHNHLNSVEEIVENLPKVWRVLIELLSHHIAPVNTLSKDHDDDDENPCYKTVDTPMGPSLVLSVSQTFIRLKDLILEKKSLEKETNHLKQLNGHLENRLQDQEKRLELVQSELSKTWLMVGKLQKQHQMLHTQEKILRYELAQKRKLLTQLKEELEYSREKWAQAREKNTNTEQQWRQLRSEFASRKNTHNDDANTSAESGYSDDKECSSSDDECSYDTHSAFPYANNNGENNLSASTSTLTEPTGNDAEVIKGTNYVNDPSETLQNVVSGESNPKCMERIVEDTWEKVSDIVQREILRLTGDQMQKTDYNSMQERLSGGETDMQSVPGTSGRSLEEVLDARNERFKRLEEEAQQLRKKVVDTNIRSDAITNKLNSLHETYGQNSSADEENTRNQKLETAEQEKTNDDKRNDC